MYEWKDDKSNLDDVIFGLNNGEYVEAECCSAPEIHTYFHRFNPSADRASAWIWCSNCKSYVHLDGFLVKRNIANCLDIDPSLLCAVPEYLDEMKSVIDKHNKQFGIL